MKGPLGKSHRDKGTKTIPGFNARPWIVKERRHRHEKTPFYSSDPDFLPYGCLFCNGACFRRVVLYGDPQGPERQPYGCRGGQCGMWCVASQCPFWQLGCIFELWRGNRHRSVSWMETVGRPVYEKTMEFVHHSRARVPGAKLFLLQR